MTRKNDDFSELMPESMGDPVAAQAALWLARHQLGTLDDKAFQHWRRADPRHALAFARALAAWDAAGRL
uniref:FecR/PupR family sigma factor regulator n=1 Tax=Novosphingobium rosa TaxID=76978 RepID=UPI001FE150FB